MSPLSVRHRRASGSGGYHRSMTSGPERVAGTLVTWNDARGFGFIRPSTGGPDAFAHITDFAWPGRRPHVGERVTFEPAVGSQGRAQAHVVLPEGRSITDRPPRFSRMPAEHRNLGYLAVAVFAVLFAGIVIGRGLPPWVVVLYVGASILSCAVYAADKTAATAGTWRVSESTLLAIGLIGGWPGAVIAQRVLRHKTRKRSFQAPFWGTAALNVLAFVVFSWVLT